MASPVPQSSGDTTEINLDMVDAVRAEHRQAKADKVAAARARAAELRQAELAESGEELPPGQIIRLR